MQTEAEVVVSMIQGMPSVAGNYQKLGRGKEGFFPRAFRRSTALAIPRSQTFSLKNCEKISVVLRHHFLFCYGSHSTLIQS